GTLGKRKMGISVVDGFRQRIGIGRSVVRTVIKFLPWEVAHFGIWQLILPSTLSEMTVLIILNAVNLAILVYFRSEEHTSELQSRFDLVCRLLLEKNNKRM